MRSRDYAGIRIKDRLTVGRQKKPKETTWMLKQLRLWLTQKNLTWWFLYIFTRVVYLSKIITKKIFFVYLYVPKEIIFSFTLFQDDVCTENGNSNFAVNFSCVVAIGTRREVIAIKVANRIILYLHNKL